KLIASYGPRRLQMRVLMFWGTGVLHHTPSRDALGSADPFVPGRDCARKVFHPLSGNRAARSDRPIKTRALVRCLWLAPGRSLFPCALRGVVAHGIPPTVASSGPGFPG